MKNYKLFGFLLALSLAAASCAATVEDGSGTTSDTSDQTTSVDTSTDTTSKNTDDTDGTDSTDSTEPEKTCSATGMEAGTTDELPAEVSKTRDAIIAAALACDIEALGKITEDSPLFKASFGDDDPVLFWTQGEENGNEPLKTLVNVLSTSVAETPIQDDTFYIWPAFFETISCDQPLDLLDPKDEADMEKLGYSQIKLVEDCQNGDGYIGYRTAIDSNGAWRNFVAGD